MFGPTETTIWSSIDPVRGVGENLSIGRPIRNTDLHVVSASHEAVTQGALGELHIGGSGQARGYVNQSALSCEKFTCSPYDLIPGSRQYAVGDWVRYLADSRLSYLGRRDHQVKVRGFRIELGEIESALSHHADIHEVVVLAREDTPGHNRLVAYIVPTADRTPSIEGLRSFLSILLLHFRIFDNH